MAIMLKKWVVNILKLRLFFFQLILDLSWSENGTNTCRRLWEKTKQVVRRLTERGNGLQLDCNCWIVMMYNKYRFFLKNVGGPEKGRYVVCDKSQLKHVLLWFCEPTGCLLAWWWLSWRGWRTSWYLQRDRPSRLHWLLEGPWRLSSGIGDQSWSLERFHGLISGRGVFWSEALCSSGISWSHGEQRFLACICVVSWLHRWRVRSYERPWWPVVFLEPFLR